MCSVYFALFTWVLGDLLDLWLIVLGTVRWFGDQCVDGSCWSCFNPKRNWISNASRSMITTFTRNWFLNIQISTNSLRLLPKNFYYPKLLQKSNRSRIPRHFPCSLRVTQSLTIRVLIYSFRQWLNSSNCPKMLRSTSGSPLASPKLISNSIQVLFFHWIIFKF